jgi:serine phosphatase RsbU (regulator of sigma subunit)
MSRGRRSPLLHGVSIIVLVAGLAITGLLSFAASEVHDANEDRLLEQQGQVAATIARAAVPNVQTPLATAAALMDATRGDETAFLRQMAPTIESRQFASVSVWRLDDLSAPIVVRGAPPELASESPETIRAFFERTERARSQPRPLAVKDLLDPPERRLGYAVVAPAPSAQFAVYAEAALPRRRQANIARDSGFDNLGYALYFGRAEEPARLLASSDGRGVPEDVRRATEVVPFGDQSLFIVVTPLEDLGGDLLQRLPLIILGTGVVFTIALTLLVERVGRQRARAEGLAQDLEVAAAENERLFTEQRDIAVTLQRSLLPPSPPTIPGVETAARYEAGVQGTEVGGDWYDVIPLAPDRLLFSVGDVCGRGLGAATTMAALRYAIRAHALEGLGPAEILGRLGPHFGPGSEDRFATAVCAVLDTTRAELTVARAGHPDLLLVTGSEAAYLGAPVGPPIGVERDAVYREVVATIPVTGAVLAFTDGLVERRGRHLDEGLDRLARSAANHDGSAAGLVEGAVDDLAATDGEDDVAVLAVRWTRTVTSPQPPRTQRDPAHA